MKAKPQVIFDNGRPLFVVVPFDDYVKLTGVKPEARPDDNELVPFLLNDYIKNPICITRIQAGLTQQELAQLLKVTQGYVSRIEGRNFKVTDSLLARIETAIAKHKPRKLRSKK